MSPATWWALAAAILAVLAEYLYRVLPGSYWQYAYIYIPHQVLLGYTLFRLIRTPRMSLVGVLVLFSMVTAITRATLSVFVLGDHVGRGTWIALGLVVLARIVQIYDR
jgi:hypothetical protein